MFLSVYDLALKKSGVNVYDWSDKEKNPNTDSLTVYCGYFNRL